MNETEKIIESIMNYLNRNYSHTRESDIQDFIQRKIEEAQKQALSEYHKINPYVRGYNAGKKETAEAIFKDFIGYDLGIDDDIVRITVRKFNELREKYLGQETDSYGQRHAVESSQSLGESRPDARKGCGKQFFDSLRKCCKGHLVKGVYVHYPECPECSGEKK